MLFITDWTVVVRRSTAEGVRVAKVPQPNFFFSFKFVEETMKKINMIDMIGVIIRTAKRDDSFLWNECFDIADVMILVESKVRKMKKSELVRLYQKAIQAKYYKSE